MDIPYRKLSSGALKSIIEEFITREGTDYGDYEFTLEEKISQLMGQLDSGEVVVSYDPDNQTCQLQSAHK